LSTLSHVFAFFSLFWEQADTGYHRKSLFVALNVESFSPFFPCMLNSFSHSFGFFFQLCDTYFYPVTRQILVCFLVFISFVLSEVFVLDHSSKKVPNLTWQQVVDPRHFYPSCSKFLTSTKISGLKKDLVNKITETKKEQIFFVQQNSGAGSIRLEIGGGSPGSYKIVKMTYLYKIVSAFNFQNFMGFKLRLIDICKKNTFYFLLNLQKCSIF
jgi:hypothetical protein